MHRLSRAALSVSFLVAAGGLAHAATFDPSRCRAGESTADCRTRLGAADAASGIDAQSGVKGKTATGAKETTSAAGEAAGEAGGGLTSVTGEAGEGMGELSADHFVRNTATFDIASALTGDGLNVQFLHSLSPKITGVLGANYSRTSSVNGALTKGGIEVGADYFIIGQHNEGLRIGPRAVASVGVDTVSNSAGFGDIGIGGEVGYNHITRQGLTAGIAAGYDLRLQGSLGGNNNADADGHPYGKLNVGYSW
jgi:hypothetical protein